MRNKAAQEDFSSRSVVEPLTDLDGESPGSLDLLLNRWLVLVRARIILVHLIVAAGFVVIADAILFSRSSPPSVIDSVAIEALILIASLAVPIILTVVALRLGIRAIFALIADGPAPAAPVLLRFISEELLQLQDHVGDLRTDGLLLTQEDVSEWVRRRCFLVATGRYLASDSCTPSVFMDRYRDLMATHADFLRRLGQCDSVRINVASTDDLISDRIEHPLAFAEYIHWHREHRVALLHVDLSDATELATQLKLRGVIDWSLWLGEATLSWNYQDDDIQMRLSFVGDQYYRRCYRFIQRLLETAIDFDALPIKESGPPFA